MTLEKTLFGFGGGACYWVNMLIDARPRGQKPEDRSHIPDMELLRAYADGKSEAAFGELVRRQVNLVYSVALRQCGGDAHLAEDVTQRVFTDLARKARQLSGHAVLGGWLFRSAQFAASDAVRAERRRRAREREAQAMHGRFSSDRGHAQVAGDADWQKLAPVLDQAIGELAAPDRDAVVLRFFEGRPFAEIGATLRLTEGAARMRVERALDKLRAALVRRGITSTAAALGVALANQAAATAPAGVAASVTGAVLAIATAAASGGAELALLTMSKFNAGIVSAIIVAGLATAVIEGRDNLKMRAEIGMLQADAGELHRLQRENQQLNTGLKKRGVTNSDADGLARLRQRVATLRARPAGVANAQTKLTAPWHNMGRATPAAAMETNLWAASVGDMDAFIEGYFFPPEMKASMETFFASQSEAVRARYGTPERLVGGIWLAMGRKQPLPVAFQILEEKQVSESEPDSAILRVRVRRPSGEEAITSMKLRRGAAGWVLVPLIIYTDAEWAKLAARIDQATGEYRVPAENDSSREPPRR